MTRMPEITTPAAIPILIARQTSAMFIVVFLFSVYGNTKTPGESFRRASIRASHPDQSLLWKKFEVFFLVELLMCHLKADMAPDR